MKAAVMASSDSPSTGTLEGQTAADDAARANEHADRAGGHVAALEGLLAYATRGRPWIVDEEGFDADAADVPEDFGFQPSPDVPTLYGTAALTALLATLEQFRGFRSYGQAAAAPPPPRHTRPPAQATAPRRDLRVVRAPRLVNCSSGRPAARRAGASAARAGPEDDADPAEPEPPPHRPARARRAGVRGVGAHGWLASPRRAIGGAR